MSTPPLGHASFAFLSALLDGRPRTLRETQERIGLETPSDSFRKVARTLARSGLIEAWDALRRSHSGDPTTAHVIVITSEGQAAWRDQSDFYLHYIQRFGTNDVAVTDDGGGILALKPVPRPPRKTKRLLTDADRAEMRKRASRPVLLTWDVIAATDLPLRVLFSLNIRDVDISRPAVRINRHWTPIETGLAQAFSRSIGKRIKGPALITQGGRAWTHQAWATMWKQIRKRTGVPTHALIRPRPSNKGQKRLA